MVECNRNTNLVRRRRIKLSSKITTAANAHRLESLLDNAEE